MAELQGRIAIITFAVGTSAPSPDAVTSIVSQFKQPQVKKLLEDPGTEFVVLGYSDLQGDEQKDFVLSKDRAEAVLQILRSKCGVLNAIQVVPMGKTDLFDPHGFASNRTVEVWAGRW